MKLPDRAVDAHVHVFRRDLPFVPDRRYTPSYDATPAMLWDALQAADVQRAVLVQPSFLGTDNAYLLDCLRADRDRFRGVAVVATDIDDRQLASLRADGIAGVRLNLVAATSPSLATAAMRDFLARVAAAGLFVELQARGRDWSELLPPLLASGVDIVVDHLGLPEPSLGVDCPGLTAIIAAAASGRVWVKLSAPYRVGPSVVSVARHLLRTVSSERLMWGSDWPWTNHEAGRSYGDCIAWLVPVCGDVTVLRRVFTANAQALHWQPARPQGC